MGFIAGSRLNQHPAIDRQTDDFVANGFDRIGFPGLSFAVLILHPNPLFFFLKIHASELIDEDGNTNDGQQERCTADQQQGSTTEADSKQ